MRVFDKTKFRYNFIALCAKSRFVRILRKQITLLYDVIIGFV